MSNKALLSFSLILAFIAIGIAGYSTYETSSMRAELDQVHGDHENLIAMIVKDNFDWRTNTDFWSYVNDNYTSEGELSIAEDNTVTLWMGLEDKVGDIMTQVVKNKVDIKDNHPNAANVATDGQSVAGTTPGLTFTVDKSSFVRGESITVSGTGDPGKVVFFTIVKVNTTSTSATTVTDTGSYVHDIPTEFDDPEGTWKLWATQGKEQSDTITVEVSD